MDTPAPAPPAPAPSSYDAVPYSVNAFPQTQPDRMAVIARLFGLESPRPDCARVLELGCASGGNLIPMALIHPRSHFVGIDLSPRQIEQGQAVITELGITNLKLTAASITDITADFGQFDYILAHGVYSWVPPAVQEKILAICAANLSPNGVAYVSYNCYPGWHARGAIREMLWYHAERFTDPKDRIAQSRSLLNFLAATLGPGDGGYSALIRQELSLLQRTPDTYLLHEHLEEFNEPLYFHQFASRAAGNGLQYLGEAQITAMVPTRFGAQAEKVLRQLAPDLLHMEQYMDFLRNRMFRQTLLCHDHVTLEHALRPAAVEGFYIASDAKGSTVKVETKTDVARTDAPKEIPAPQADGAGEAMEFKSSGAPKLVTRDTLLQRALTHLAGIYPRHVAYEKLLAELLAAAQNITSAETTPAPPPASPHAADAAHLPQRLLNCYASGLVEFSLAPANFEMTITEKPIAWPYARLRARTGEKITNQRLETIALSEPSRLVLQNLDGAHDRAALIDILTPWVQEAQKKLAAKQAQAKSAQSNPTELKSPSAETPATETARQRAEKYVDQLLPAIAKSALLIA